MRFRERMNAYYKPADWERLPLNHKIAWYEKRQKRNKEEEKEYQLLLFQKRFEGMAEYVNAKREKERKSFEKISAKCREKREVKCCKECSWFRHCYHHEQPEMNYYGLLALGQAIVLEIEKSIKRCWLHGWKDQLEYWVKVLANDRTNVITANTVDGYASSQAIIVWCKKNYGDFNKRYVKCQKIYKPQLEKLEAQREKCKDKAKIERINKQILDTLIKLYGDTIH